MEYLRKRGIIAVIYLDDIFCIASTFLECQKSINLIKTTLESLGFLINHKKSCLQPSMRCRYLGFIFDSEKMVLELPSEKRQKIKILVLKFLTIRQCRLREFAQFLGILISVCPAIDYSWTYTKKFERFKFQCLCRDPSYNQIIEIPEDLKPDMLWWLEHIKQDCSIVKFNNFRLEMYSDASLTGWGAYYDNRGIWILERG